MSIKDELKRELKFAPFIEKVLNKNIHLLIERGFKMFEIEKASIIQDTEQGFDFLFTGSGLKIPARIRKPNCDYRDFTIRWQSSNGGYTEIDKLNDGAGDVYFYAWTKKGDLICDWILVDLHVLRKDYDISRNNQELIKRVKSNGDGTYHTQVRLYELNNALINGTPSVMKQANKAPRVLLINNGVQGVINFNNH